MRNKRALFSYKLQMGVLLILMKCLDKTGIVRDTGNYNPNQITLTQCRRVTRFGTWFDFNLRR